MVQGLYGHPVVHHLLAFAWTSEANQHINCFAIYGYAVCVTAFCQRTIYGNSQAINFNECRVRQGGQSFSTSQPIFLNLWSGR
jgi:hypothetical protein